MGNNGYSLVKQKINRKNKNDFKKRAYRNSIEKIYFFQQKYNLLKSILKKLDKNIDILIITKNKSWEKSSEKYKIISSLTESAKSLNLPLDIQIVDKKSFYSQYPHNPSLIYQLKDCRIIYGKIKIPKKINLTEMDLRMKLDWSDIADENSEGNEIYHAIRNTILVRLLLDGVIDNNLLYKKLVELIGMNLLTHLKNNTASKLEKKIAINYLNKLTELTRKEIIANGKK